MTKVDFIAQELWAWGNVRVGFDPKITRPPELKTTTEQQARWLISAASRTLMLKDKVPFGVTTHKRDGYVYGHIRTEPGRCSCNAD